MPQQRTLPFCAEFESCSCCTAQHARSILRTIISGLRDPLLSLACRDWTARMACRQCDPDVGTGLKPAVCQQTCDDWFASCKDDFFEQDHLGGQIRPCSEEAVVCSKLSEIAADGSSLCGAHKLPIAQVNQKCFDGRPQKPNHGSCQQGSRKSSSSKQRASQFAAVPQLLLVCSSAMLLLVAMLCWRHWRSSLRPQRAQRSEQSALQTPAASSLRPDPCKRQAVNLSHSRLASQS